MLEKMDFCEIFYLADYKDYPNIDSNYLTYNFLVSELYPLTSFNF